MPKNKTKKCLIDIGGGESDNITKDSLEITEKFLEVSGGAKKAVAAIRRISYLFGKYRCLRRECSRIAARLQIRFAKA